MLYVPPMAFPHQEREVPQPLNNWCSYSGLIVTVLDAAFVDNTLDVSVEISSTVVIKKQSDRFMFFTINTSVFEIISAN